MSKVRTFYLGFVDGRPHVERTIDTYGTALKVDLFTKQRDAKARFEDVRPVKIVQVQTKRRD